jgi:hypothetical protein
MALSSVPNFYPHFIPKIDLNYSKYAQSEKGLRILETLKPLCYQWID